MEWRLGAVLVGIGAISEVQPSAALYLKACVPGCCITLE